MTAATRRRLAALLAGVAAALVALAVAAALREDACRDAGGRWLAGRQCLVAGAPSGAGAGRAYALGALAGLVTAVLLWRTFTFFADRRARAAR